MLPSSPTMAEEGGEEIPLLQLARYERRFAVFASVRPAIEKSGGLRPPNRGVAVGSGDPWHRENNVSAATSGISHAQLRGALSIDLSRVPIVRHPVKSFSIFSTSWDFDCRVRFPVRSRDERWIVSRSQS